MERRKEHLVKPHLKLITACSALAIFSTLLVTACGGGGGHTNNGSVTADSVINAAVSARTTDAGAHAFDLANQYTGLFPATQSNPGGLGTDFENSVGEAQAGYNLGKLPETFAEAIDYLKTISTTTDTRDQIIAQLNAQMSAVGASPVTPTDKVLVLLGRRDPRSVAPKPITPDESISPFDIFLVSAWLTDHAPPKDGVDGLPALAAQAAKGASLPKARDEADCVAQCQATYEASVAACDLTKQKDSQAALDTYNKNVAALRKLLDTQITSLLGIEGNLSSKIQANPNSPNVPYWNHLIQVVEEAMDRCLQTYNANVAKEKAIYDAKIKQINDANTACKAKAQTALDDCIDACHAQGGD